MLTQKDLEREVREISNFLGVSNYDGYSIVACTTKDKVLQFAIMRFAKARLLELGFLVEEIEIETVKNWLEKNEILYLCISFKEGN